MPLNHRNKRALQITSTPFKPSFLSIPPSPCSPRTPLTPAARPKHHHKTTQLTNVYTLPASSAPPTPLSWIWTCHKCRSNYHLSVTRRCLEDGHVFCSGTATVKGWRESSSGGAAQKVRRHRACASEFDYQGWNVWGRWRRGGAMTTMMGGYKKAAAAGRRGKEKEMKKDCWNMCDYPSECRWGKSFGVHAPVEDVSCGAVEDRGDVVTGLVGGGLETLESEEKTEKEEYENVEKTSFWGAILASAERRKIERASGNGNGGSIRSRSERRRASSPLATVLEEELDEEDNNNDNEVGREKYTPPLRDTDGDISITTTTTTIDPSLLTKRYSPLLLTESIPSLSASPAPSSSASTTVDSLRVLISSRKRERRTRSSRSSSHIRETRYTDPAMSVPQLDSSVRDDEYFGLGYLDEALEGFTPLERVASRHGGYFSKADVWVQAPCF